MPKLKRTKTILAVVIPAVILIALYYCLNGYMKSLALEPKENDTSDISGQNPDIISQTPASSLTSASSSASELDSIVYENTEYGFSFSLPADWKGYTIISSEWEGSAADEDSGEKVVETGPVISIRDPRWSSETMRQDIPIMVFTLQQWNLLQNDEFHIGAAPVGPTELGRNNKYVFALPARYNFAFPEGYEEVESILAGYPLTTNQVS